ncbi:MAG: PHP-associated domain-containing protein [Thermacetogeniaceae bacterium]
MTAADKTSTPILAELHCHTQFFGWQHFSRRRLDSFLSRARRLGVKILAFTEHANIKSYWKLYTFLEESTWRWEGMTILTGAEITVQEGGDILVYGPPSTFKELPDRLGGWPAGRVRPPLERLLEAVEALNLMKVGAHPLRHGQSLGDVPSELLSRLDALELNAREFARQSRVSSLAADLNLPLVGGSDAHFSRHLGRVLNRLPGWVKDMPTLRQAVRSGQVEVLHHGLQVYPSPQQSSRQNVARELQTTSVR